MFLLVPAYPGSPGQKAVNTIQYNTKFVKRHVAVASVVCVCIFTVDSLTVKNLENR